MLFKLCSTKLWLIQSSFRVDSQAQFAFACLRHWTPIPKKTLTLLHQLYMWNQKFLYVQVCPVFAFSHTLPRVLISFEKEDCEITIDSAFRKIKLKTIGLKSQVLLLPLSTLLNLIWFLFYFISGFNRFWTRKPQILAVWRKCYQ